MRQQKTLGSASKFGRSSGLRPPDLFLRNAGVFDEPLFGSGHSGNALLARLNDVALKFCSKNMKNHKKQKTAQPAQY